MEQRDAAVMGWGKRGYDDEIQERTPTSPINERACGQEFSKSLRTNTQPSESEGE